MPSLVEIGLVALEKILKFCQCIFHCHYMAGILLIQRKIKTINLCIFALSLFSSCRK